MSVRNWYMYERFDNNDPRREWRDRDTDELLHVEPLKARFAADTDPKNREGRISHTAAEIMADGERDTARVMVRAEDEWREACKRAGKDPLPW